MYLNYSLIYVGEYYSTNCPRTESMLCSVAAFTCLFSAIKQKFF